MNVIKTQFNITKQAPKTVLSDLSQLTVTIPNGKIIDLFEFDDGISIELHHTNWSWPMLQAHFYNNGEFIKDMSVGAAFNVQNYFLYGDYVAYIFACVVSYIRYYPTLKETCDPYRPCWDYYKFLDIKHKLRNLRKVSTIKWGHKDIIENIDQYVQYAKKNRFARESLINFYSRFLKLSIMYNNKKLKWILDETDSFINYGYIIPEDTYSQRCGNKKCMHHLVGCIEYDNIEFLFDLEIHNTDDDNDNILKKRKTCESLVPTTKPNRKCKYEQWYHPKSKYNHRVGIRQQTSEFIKMQLKDEIFTISGPIPYALLKKYADRIRIKTSSTSVFLAIMSYIYNVSVSKLKNPENTNEPDVFKTLLNIPDDDDDDDDEIKPTSSTSVPVLNISGEINSNQRRVEYIMEEYDISVDLEDMLINFLIINRKHLWKFINCKNLGRPEHLRDLYDIALAHRECKHGKLKDILSLIERRKLLNT